MEERDVAVKTRVIQLHGEGLSDRQIARVTKVPPSTVYRWIKENREVKQIGEILEELAQRYGRQSFSNLQIKRKYASRSPDMVVRWLNKLSDTGNIVNGYRVERIYQSHRYGGEPYQDFLLSEV